MGYSQMEWVDIVDENGCPTGKTVSREQAVRKNSVQNCIYEEELLMVKDAAEQGRDKLGSGEPEGKENPEQRKGEPNGEGAKILLVVSFGTSVPETREKTIGAIERALAEDFPDCTVRRAFTSGVILRIVRRKEGLAIDSLDEALERAAADGAGELIIQPTHLMYGYEYEKLCGAVELFREQSGKKAVIGKPLLGDEADLEAVARAVAGAARGESTVDLPPKTAFVFMGHGTDHPANVVYLQLQETMLRMGFRNCFVGTVEGFPEETEVHTVLRKVREAGYTDVVLRPLMVVAGDHALNDMAGDAPDSWKNLFGEVFGRDHVHCQMAGLGELPEIRKLYSSHVERSQYDENM